jgi:hypothetical protein
MLEQEAQLVQLVLPLVVMVAQGVLLFLVQTLKQLHI